MKLGSKFINVNGLFFFWGGGSSLLGIMFGTPRPTIYKWMEMVISNHFLYKDLVHHPIETSIYKWLALGFQEGIMFLVQE